MSILEVLKLLILGDLGEMGEVAYSLVDKGSSDDLKLKSETILTLGA